MNFMRRAGGGALLVIALLVVGCGEISTSRYPTIANAERDGAMSRGWLPEVLAPDATDIEETHDLDSNRGYGNFALNDALLKRLKSVCRPSLAVPPPVPKAHWWQDTFGKRQQPIGETFECGHFFIATDSDRRLGRFWTRQN